MAIGEAFHKTIALNDTYTTVPLDIDMGACLKYCQCNMMTYNFDAARLSNTIPRTLFTDRVRHNRLPAMFNLPFL